ncbi:Anoctamin-7 [Podila clonocystis]|nr:Anoctamin-7 [Podila clonocystis]
MANDQNLNVISRRMTSYRVVHMLYQTDADLFDAIQEWKEIHPDLWVDDAIDAFASAKGADALAHLVYSTEAFDIILKYSASHADLCPIFDQQPKNDRSHRSPSQKSHRETNGDSSRFDENIETGSIQPISLPSANVSGDMDSVTTTGEHHSRLSQLRHSSSKLLSRAFSLGSSQHRSNQEPSDPQKSKLGHAHSNSLSHIAVAISSPTGNSSISKQPFQPLHPLDCSTDLFPSPQSSIVALDEQQHATSMPTLLPSDITVPQSSCGENSESTQHPPHHHRHYRLRRRGSKPSKAKLRQWKIQLHRRDYQLALLKQGVFIELEKSIDSDAVYVKVLAPFWRLEDEAQKTSCKADLANRGAGGLTLFAMLAQSVNSIMMRTDSNNKYGRKTGLRSALRRGAYQKLFALHDGSFRSHHARSAHDVNYRAQLQIKWAKRFWRNQPLDLVNAYFGERIGVYFAWLGHYTQWLTIPAAVGTAVFVFGIINAARLKKLDATPNALFAIFDNVLTMPFALFMSIWSTVYIEFWKRANQYYAYRWNMIDYERVELPRTEFRATRVRFSAVTGKKELYYPMYWKALRILASSVAVFLAVCVVIGSVACLMIFKAWCRNHMTGPYAATLATAMLNLVIIIVLGEIWCRLAEWLTDKENHKYTESYEDECLYDACITELTVQLAVVFIGKQFLNGLFEMVFPWIERTWNRKQILADQALKSREYLDRRKRARAPQWVKDDNLPSYQGRILKCYRKTVIQFGFCTLFVTSFPVAPAFALINNWIDIRMEAYRLLTQYQRPIALRAQDIGMWEKIMEFVSFTSVITNAAIIAFSSLWIKQNLFTTYLHANSDGELLAARLGFILVFEHVVFLFKIILRASIPSVPLTIKLAVQRSKHLNRMANEGQESELDEDLDMYSTSESEDDEDDEEYDGTTDDGNGSRGDGFLGPELGHVQSDIPHNGVTLRDEGVTPYPEGPAQKRRNTWAPFGMLQRGSNVEVKQRQQDMEEKAQAESLQQASSLPTIKENPHSRSSSRPDSTGYGVGYPSVQTPLSNPQNKALNHRSSLNRPVPYRANTEMDGEWVVLEEPRI